MKEPEAKKTDKLNAVSKIPDANLKLHSPTREGERSMTLKNTKWKEKVSGGDIYGEPPKTIKKLVSLYIISI